MAMSLVTLLAPIGSTEEKTGEPSIKIVILVTLPPISTRATPSF